MKKIGTGIGRAALLVALGANLFVGARLYSKEAGGREAENPYEQMRLFTEAIEEIRNNYVDSDRVAYRDLVQNALRGMLQALDPYSQFMDPDDYTDMKDDTSGQFGGLGIVVSTRDGLLTVISPMEDTPGWRAGLLAGDQIIEIDGQSTEGIDVGEAVKKLRGPPDSKVRIKILRPKSQEIKSFELVREEIKVKSVKGERILKEGIGYIRVTQFSEPTADELQAAVERLSEDGLKALILDLRNNPGGLLDQALAVSQKFLPRNTEIVSTQGRTRDQQRVYKARGSKHYLDFPMVLLVNGGSASASEIVAGALKDHKRAILIGEKTFGKGSVQSVLPMRDGTAMRLTTAKYYSPSKRVIHGKGIEPDIVVPMAPEDQRRLILESSRPPGAPPAAGEEGDAAPVRDVQLDRAVDVLKGILTFNAKAADPVRVATRPEATATAVK